MAKKEKTYGEAIEELQSILDKLESENMDVDELTEEIKKASALIKFCKGKLFKADAEIKKIIENLA